MCLLKTDFQSTKAPSLPLVGWAAGPKYSPAWENVEAHAQSSTLQAGSCENVSIFLFWVHSKYRLQTINSLSWTKKLLFPSQKQSFIKKVAHNRRLLFRLWNNLVAVSSWLDHCSSFLPSKMLSLSGKWNGLQKEGQLFIYLLLWLHL